MEFGKFGAKKQKWKKSLEAWLKVAFPFSSSTYAILKDGAKSNKTNNRSCFHDLKRTIHSNIDMCMSSNGTLPGLADPIHLSWAQSYRAGSCFSLTRTILETGREGNAYSGLTNRVWQQPYGAHHIIGPCLDKRKKQEVAAAEVVFQFITWLGGKEEPAPKGDWKGGLFKGDLQQVMEKEVFLLRQHMRVQKGEGIGWCNPFPNLRSCGICTVGRSQWSKDNISLMWGSITAVTRFWLQTSVALESLKI